MTGIHFDQLMPDDRRRQKIFEGDIFIYSPSAASMSLCQLTRTLLTEAFGPHAAQTAQDFISPDDYVELLADLRPSYTSHPRVRSLIKETLIHLGLDSDDTYLKQPDLRAMTSGLLNAGPGLLLEAHRDTWYADPFSQINWWMPIFDYTTESGMEFYPDYFTKGIENDSEFYDLREWRASGMAQAAKRKERVAGDNSMAREKPNTSSDLRIVMPPGAIMLFSAAHLHATTPNTSRKTRFSIDFRTVNVQDVISGASADNVDTAARGSTLGDFSRLSDGSKLRPDKLKNKIEEV
ncbi:hypothetical protein ABT272_45465 [Streptomyces sp900105245]|uniref:Phytanoyl-CoA dioxygenase family protein n=1 Tax=Streptomyces sp. 900105245 TaxID=3154379 RepID=A0ABV1ULT8_9ACTN